MNNLAIEGVEQQSLGQFTEQAYLNYAMYVIMDRALPHIGDGLKPVQRRIIYAMSELGLNNLAKYKKSARTVGDVLGKFHPHGDSACYEAMVLLAQPFSYRYPLIDGQGNWGAPDDPKSFAAMRYTEARLSKFAACLLSELGQGTVDWAPNFDGTLQEPKMLPARLPTLLLNGTTGIAVGMATDVPPHNLKEVVEACLHLLKTPKATVTELCKILKGPDYPTEAEIITPKAQLQKIYETGGGTLKMRAVSIRENGDIIITALPHQVSGAKILEQIAAQMQAKKLPMVADLRDESDHENPTRLVIEPRSNKIDVDGLMSHLYATTDLERTYRVNMNVIGLDGKPHVKPLNVFLNEWLTFRTETIRRRLQYRLEKVLARLHLLEGFLIAFLNIDEVIHIIRTEDKPKPVLMKRFKLTDTQADAILDLKLRHLAKLEEVKIQTEQNDLAKERKTLEETLDSSRKLKNLIRKELTEDAKKFGDDRRSPIVERVEAQAMSMTQRLPSEPVTVVLSAKGWVRAAKGHEVDGAALNYKSGDSFQAQICGKSNEQVVFLDSTGRSYAMLAHGFPSARSLGEPLTTKCKPPAGATFVGLLMGASEDKVLACSSAGYGFIGKFEDMITKNKAGKAFLNVPKDTKALPALFLPKAAKWLALTTNSGYLLLISIKDIPELTKGKGNKLINVPSDKLKSGDEFVLDMAILGKSDSLQVKAGRRKFVLSPKDLKHYMGERGRRGLKLPRGAQKVDAITVVSVK